MTQISVRPARTSDVPHIQRLVEPLAERRILLGKDRVVLYEAVQEFRIAEDETGAVIGCGARRAARQAILERIEADARELGLSRLFCLTFETEFFGRHGFEAVEESIVEPDVFAQLVLSPDEGIAEFLDLSRVKQNTLGNTRMLKRL